MEPCRTRPARRVGEGEEHVSPSQLLDLNATELIDVWVVTTPGEGLKIIIDNEAEAIAYAKEVRSDGHGVQKKMMTRSEWESLGEFQGF